MDKNKPKFALFGNKYHLKEPRYINDLLSILKKHGASLAVESEFYQYITEILGVSLNIDETITNNDFTANYAISFGGDGTFLNTATRIGDKAIPIIGINTGRLGFLADIIPDDISEMMSAIFNGEYHIEKRSLLKVESTIQPFIHHPYALNEVAVLKHDNSSMIRIDTTLDGNYLTTYQADGLIVSTPTGSTGYSLSVGGPIVAPDSHSVVLTPVAAHSLNVRPIVLDDTITIKLTVKSRNHNYLTAIDGRSISCSDSAELKIRKAPFYIHVVKRNNVNFFDTLRNKLMWGIDQRN